MAKQLTDYSSELEILTVRKCLRIVEKSHDKDGAILNLLGLEIELSKALNDYYNPPEKV